MYLHQVQEGAETDDPIDLRAQIGPAVSASEQVRKSKTLEGSRPLAIVKSAERAGTLPGLQLNWSNDGFALCRALPRKLVTVESTDS